MSGHYFLIASLLYNFKRFKILSITDHHIHMLHLRTGGPGVAPFYKFINHTFLGLGLNIHRSIIKISNKTFYAKLICFFLGSESVKNTLHLSGDFECHILKLCHA
jgi:hypothetical protein